MFKNLSFLGILIIGIVACSSSSSDNGDHDAISSSGFTDSSSMLTLDQGRPSPFSDGGSVDSSPQADAIVVSDSKFSLATDATMPDTNPSDTRPDSSILGDGSTDGSLSPTQIATIITRITLRKVIPPNVIFDMDEYSSSSTYRSYLGVSVLVAPLGSLCYTGIPGIYKLNADGVYEPIISPSPNIYYKSFVRTRQPERSFAPVSPGQILPTPMIIDKWIELHWQTIDQDIMALTPDSTFLGPNCRR